MGPPWVEEVAEQRRVGRHLEVVPTGDREDVERAAGSGGLADGRLQRTSDAAEIGDQPVPASKISRILGMSRASKIRKQSAPFQNGSRLACTCRAVKLGEPSAPSLRSPEVSLFPVHRSRVERSSTRS
jgi:hypothetical protein